MASGNIVCFLVTIEDIILLLKQCNSSLNLALLALCSFHTSIMHHEHSTSNCLSLIQLVPDVAIQPMHILCLMNLDLPDLAFSTMGVLITIAMTAQAVTLALASGTRDMIV